MASIRLSIIIPARDAAPFLGTMFKSLYQQALNLNRVQVIFINDGSADETPAVLDEFGAMLPNLTAITNESAVGLANGRNMGLDVAKGEYIAFLDGDDWLLPNHLSTSLSAIENLDVDFVRCDHVRVQGTQRELRRAPLAIRNRSLSPRRGILPVRSTTMVDYPFAWAGMFHRRLADEGILYFPKGFMTAEDRSWIWNLHLNADSFAVIDAPGIAYRRGMDSSLSQILDERQLDFIRAFEEIFDLVRKDENASVYTSKAVRNWLAILHQQAARFKGSERNLTQKFSLGARRISARLPWLDLKREFLQSKWERQVAVFQFMPHRRELVKELTR